MRTMPALMSLSNFRRICGCCMCFCAVLGSSCRSCSTCRMTGSVMMFWISGSLIALALRCASSSSEASPEMNCKPHVMGQHKSQTRPGNLQASLHCIQDELTQAACCGLYATGKHILGRTETARNKTMCLMQ